MHCMTSCLCLQDADEGSTTCSEHSSLPDVVSTPVVTRPAKKHVMFQSEDLSSCVGAEKEARGLSKLTIPSSFEGNLYVAIAISPPGMINVVFNCLNILASSYTSLYFSIMSKHLVNT